MKNLIFDVSALVNCWVKAPSCAATAELLDAAPHPGVNRWVVVSTLPTLAYVTGKAFKRQGIEPKAVAHQLVPQFMNDLLNTVEVLSNFGFEQTTVYQQARDFEDAQIAAAARSLCGQQMCVVTEENTMKGAQICLQSGQTWGDCRRHHQPPAQRVCYLVSPVFFSEVVANSQQETKFIH